MITAIIVGAGHRSMLYASLAELAADKLRIVGVADPNPHRRDRVRSRFGFGPEMCFENALELAGKERLADAVINGTMDMDHVPTTIPLLERGYHVLLEKPFAVNVGEVAALEAAVKRCRRHVMICHVLRYAPFYAEMRRMALAGAIGEIVNIQTAEHVSYHHIANCYVRGKWNREDKCGSGTLMAKCCHDLDLLCWFMSGVAPLQVSSFGGRRFFTRDHAPDGSGEYCLLDCPLERACDYSCRRLNLERPERWKYYVWANMESHGAPSMEDYERELRRVDNPYARCVWKSENTVVDRQSVLVEFANGATASHNLVGGTSRPCRKIHIVGTRGELEGTMDDNRFVFREIDTPAKDGYRERVVDLNDEGDTTGAFGGHGGGDIRLAEDFVTLLSGGEPSISLTTLADSIHGHRIGFAAETSRLENRVIKL